MEDRHVVHSACPLDCPDACSLEVTVGDGRILEIDGSEANPFTGGFICGKVRKASGHVHGEARIRYPGVRGDAPKGEASFDRVSWDDALDLIAARMLEARARHGGEAILPLSYGGSNGNLTQDTTDARLFRRLGASRLARTVCAAPSGRAAAGLYGKMAGVALPDYRHARLIVVWGCNPAVSGIHLVPVLEEARERGARLVVVDPRRTRVARRADLHLPVRPGTDLPVALALLRRAFEGDGADEEFLARHAVGVEELRRRAAGWSLERAAETAGLEVADLERFARMYADAEPAVIRCGWGLERNRNGGSAVAAVLALPAVYGKFGIRGGGYTMSNSSAWNVSSDAAIAEAEPETRRINMNRTGRALTGLADPPVEVLFVYNCNPAATLPNQELLRRGLSRTDLFTVVFDPVMTDTCRYADVVLPATTFFEHDDLRRGYGAMVLQRVRPVIPPVGESRPNVEVFADLCRRCGLERRRDPPVEELIDTLLGDGGVRSSEQRDDGDGGPADVDRLERDGMLTARFDGGDGPVQFVDVRPGTADGRIRLVPEELDREAPLGLYGYREDPGSAEHPLALVSPATGRTISSTFGELRRGRVALEIHPDDAADRGIGDGDPVRVHNDHGEVRCAARLSEAVRSGVVHLPKGLWSHNTENGATANALVPDTLADLGGGACFNDARVEVEPA